jgi:hypothetical protein
MLMHPVNATEEEKSSEVRRYLRCTISFTSRSFSSSDCSSPLQDIESHQRGFRAKLPHGTTQPFAWEMLRAAGTQGILWVGGPPHLSLLCLAWRPWNSPSTLVSFVLYAFISPSILSSLPSCGHVEKSAFEIAVSLPRPSPPPKPKDLSIGTWDKGGGTHVNLRKQLDAPLIRTMRPGQRAAGQCGRRTSRPCEVLPLPRLHF